MYLPKYLICIKLAAQVVCPYTIYKSLHKKHSVVFLLLICDDSQTTESLTVSKTFLVWCQISLSFIRRNSWSVDTMCSKELLKKEWKFSDLRCFCVDEGLAVAKSDEEMAVLVIDW